MEWPPTTPSRPNSYARPRASSPLPDRKACNPLKYGPAISDCRLFFRFSTASFIADSPRCVRPALEHRHFLLQTLRGWLAPCAVTFLKAPVPVRILRGFHRSPGRACHHGKQEGRPLAAEESVLR